MACMLVDVLARKRKGPAVIDQILCGLHFRMAARYFKPTVSSAKIFTVGLRGTATHENWPETPRLTMQGGAELTIERCNAEIFMVRCSLEK